MIKNKTSWVLMFDLLLFCLFEHHPCAVSEKDCQQINGVKHCNECTALLEPVLLGVTPTGTMA